MKKYYHLAGITSDDHEEIYRFYDFMTKNSPTAGNKLNLKVMPTGELACFFVSRSIFKFSLTQEIIAWIMQRVCKNLPKKIES